MTRSSCEIFRKSNGSTASTLTWTEFGERVCANFINWKFGVPNELLLNHPSETSLCRSEHFIFRGIVLSLSGFAIFDSRRCFRSCFLLLILGFSGVVFAQDPDSPVNPEIPIKSQNNAVQEELSTAAPASQDPPKLNPIIENPVIESKPVQVADDSVEAPEDPDEQLRKKVTDFFASSEQSDWIRALTLLGARQERENPPEWINPMLLELLTDRALENPTRTRLILADELINNSNTGILILTVLLRQEANWPFLEEVESSFRQWALDEAVRERLITEFRVATDPLQLARLFDILTVGDPRDVLEVTIDRLRDSAEVATATLVASLSEFMKLDLDQAGWITWWDTNSDKPILDGIVSRTEAAGEIRELALWNRADRFLQEEKNPVRYVNWLIESMAPGETNKIRTAALVRSGVFAREVIQSDTALGVEERVRIFKPLVQKLVNLLQDEMSSVRSSEEFLELTLLCLASLREFGDFKDDPDLIRALKFHITRLNPDLTNGARRVAREALNTASALRSPVSDEVDAALERFLPAVEQKPDVAEIRRLVAASRSIGFSENTVEILFRVAKVSPSLADVVLEALVYGQVPDSSVPLVLEYYGQLVESSDESNIRSLAINGIGRLGVDAGISILVSMVLQGPGESDSEREAALAMIGSIGGPGAVTAFVNVLTELSAEDRLRELALQQALNQAGSDNTLALAQEFIFDSSGGTYPWASSALKKAALISIIESKGQPNDLRSRYPERFQRWVLLQAQRFDFLVAELIEQSNAAEEADNSEIEESWKQLKQELANSLALIGDEPVIGVSQIPAARLLRLARDMDGRAVVMEALGAGVSTRVVDTFTVYLDAVSGSSTDLTVKSYFERDPWSWLLDHLEVGVSGSGDIELIRALRVLAEERSERENILNRIDALEARSEPMDTDPVPAPAEDTQEEPVRE